MVRSRTICGSVLDLIGDTPLVALDRLTPASSGRVLAKIESQNPGLSVKDRPALQIIADAERRGLLRAGATVVERTSGNMGTGLAIACALKGYKLVVVMSAGNSSERRRIMEALGAKVIIVPQVTGTPGQVTGEDLNEVERVTQAVTRNLSAFRADQFRNPSSIRAHLLGTGPEIWRQTRGRLDAFVSVAGSAGTFVGVARYLKAKRPSIACYAVEPATARILSGIHEKPGPHRLQGIGYIGLPDQWDPTLVDGFVAISDRQAAETARALARTEGILAGFTSGANVAAARRLAAKRGRRYRVATVITDSGLKYLSTDLFQRGGQRN